MAFKYDISEATDIYLGDVAGKQAIVMEFKYVRFVLTLDDEAKTRRLAEILVGHALEGKAVPEEKPVKLPRLYARDTKKR